MNLTPVDVIWNNGVLKKIHFIVSAVRLAIRETPERASTESGIVPQSEEKKLWDTIQVYDDQFISNTAKFRNLEMQRKHVFLVSGVAWVESALRTIHGLKTNKNLFNFISF